MAVDVVLVEVVPPVVVPVDVVPVEFVLFVVLLVVVPVDVVLDELREAELDDVPDAALELELDVVGCGPDVTLSVSLPDESTVLVMLDVSTSWLWLFPHCSR